MTNTQTSLWKKLTPGVHKSWLHLVSGTMWSVVGVWLCKLAYGWLKPESIVTVTAMASAGILLALLIYLFGFANLANGNIHRINALPGERACIFAFQKWSNYIIIVVMISLGIFLRKSGLVPKPYLAAMYTGIGGGLFLASLHYYRWLLQRSKRSTAI